MSSLVIVMDRVIVITKIDEEKAWQLVVLNELLIFVSTFRLGFEF